MTTGAEAMGTGTTPRPFDRTTPDIAALPRAGSPEDAPMARANALARPTAPRHKPGRIPTFYGRIQPRRYDRHPPPTGAREVPRGGEPAAPGRPLIALLAILALVAGIWVQVERFQDCRAEGGETLACLMLP